MSPSSRESSPDPITLPSSPPSGRKPGNSLRKRRQSTPRRARSHTTPLKSLVLDTPGANHESPWRIRVTVQAEPREGVSGKRYTRTTTIPLKSPNQTRSSSPAKRVGAVMHSLGNGKRPPRKRKGTPMREERSAPQLRQQQLSDSDPDLLMGDSTGAAVDALMQSPPPPPPPVPIVTKSASVGERGAMLPPLPPPLPVHTPPRRASGRLARLSAQWSSGTGRTRRLGVAREELDQALQDASAPYCDAPGDITLSHAEDFTMVTMESLQTAKDASMAHASHLITARKGEKSTLGMSYLSSSPPQTQSRRQYLDAAPAPTRARQHTSHNSAVHSRAAQVTLQSPFEPVSSATKRSSLHSGSNDMSWRPIAPTKLSSFQRVLGERMAEVHIPVAEWQRDREATCQQILLAKPEDVLAMEDDTRMTAEESGEEKEEEEEEEEVGGTMADDDLWQREASRALEQSHHQTPQYSSPSAQAETEVSPVNDEGHSHSPERVENLFSHIPLKPARSKLPRTWRRSSGMDFSYVDSPAHGAVVESADERRQSADGSGVLTPPSTDEEREVEPAEDEEDGAGTVEMQDKADDQLQSEFTVPEAEATRYQDVSEWVPHGHGSVDRPADEPQWNEGRSPITDLDEDDSGSFFKHNMPQVFLKERPKRRPPRRPTADLAELLDLHGESDAARATGSRPSCAAHNGSSSRQRGPSMPQDPMVAEDSPLRTNNGKALNSPFRKSLLHSSKIPGTAPRVDGSQDEQAGASWGTPSQQTKLREPAVSPSMREDRGRLAVQQLASFVTHHLPTGEPSALPKRRGRQRRVQQPADSYETNTTASFASNTSDQRQHLQVAQSARYDRPQSSRPHTAVGFEDYMGDQQHQKDPSDHAGGETRTTQEGDEGSRGIEGADADVAMDGMEGNEGQAQILDHTHHLSYEEELNLDSPTKIQVKFNDTMDSSWLSQARRQPPLYRSWDSLRVAQAQTTSQPTSHPTFHGRPIAMERPPRPQTITLVAKKAASQPGLLSRLSSTFWNAVIRPTGPAEILPQPIPSPAVFSVTLRSQIRSRYGVLSDSFPWTMAHIRTLHRMLNSLTSGRNDTLIPRKGGLPLELESKINTIQNSVTGYQWVFTRQHSYVVWSFLQVLVSPTTVSAMRQGEIEWLGDDTARRIRGYFDPIRHGDDAVWSVARGSEKSVLLWLEKQHGIIGVDFVARALGDCVLSNEQLARKIERLEGREEEW